MSRMMREREIEEEVIPSSQFLSNVNLSTSARARLGRFWAACVEGSCAGDLIQSGLVIVGKRLRRLWQFDRFLFASQCLLILMVILSSILWKKAKIAAEVTGIIGTYACIAAPSLIFFIAGAFRYLETIAKIIVTVSLLETLAISAVVQFVTLNDIVSKVATFAADAILGFGIGITAFYQRKPNDAAAAAAQQEPV